MNNNIFDVLKTINESMKIKISDNFSSKDYPYLSRGNGIFGTPYLLSMDVYDQDGFSLIGKIHIERDNFNVIREGNTNSFITDKNFIKLCKIYTIRMLIVAFDIAPRTQLVIDGKYFIDSHNINCKIALEDFEGNIQNPITADEVYQYYFNETK